MVQAHVDNDAISIVLKKGESTTVPSGQVWKVTMNCRAPAKHGGLGYEVNQKRVLIRINGTSVGGSGSIGGYQGLTSNSTAPFETIVVGGDTIKAKNGGVHIGGFVVKK